MGRRRSRRLEFFLEFANEAEFSRPRRHRHEDEFDISLTRLYAFYRLF